jgi:hypothetical protein
LVCILRNVIDDSIRNELGLVAKDIIDVGLENQLSTGNSINSLGTHSGGNLILQVFGWKWYYPPWRSWLLTDVPLSRSPVMLKLTILLNLANILCTRIQIMKKGGGRCVYIGGRKAGKESLDRQTRIEHES